jgi:ribosomal protein S18 acetylase RimI-like enzyme
MAIEQAAVRSWPALETAGIDGWLWRYASGGSLRANSVAALAFAGVSVEAAIAEVERRYREKGAPCRFTICDVSSPADLDLRLEALGYARGEDHVTMAKEVAPGAAVPGDMETSIEPTSEWLAVYLTGLSADRKAVAPAILAGLPPRRVFLACRRAGAIVASGMSVADGDLASVQCMATLASVRRQGCALSVLRVIEVQAAQQGCTRLYLQAEGANTPAIALYERFGFRVAGRYHVRTRH